MKVRDFIKPNRNGDIVVTVYDKLKTLMCMSLNEATLVQYLDREVLYWTVNNDTDLPGLSIYLKEVDDEG